MSYFICNTTWYLPLHMHNPKNFKLDYYLFSID